MAQLNTQNSKPKTIIRWLLGALLLVIALWLVFVLAGWALRHIAIVQITELTNTKVQAKSIDFNLDGSALIKKLTIGPQQSRDYDNTILKAETVYARFNFGSLLLLRPQLREINIQDFVFDAQYDLDTGQWNIATLKPKISKGSFGKMPVVNLERGRLQYSKVSDGKVEVIAALPLDARFRPSEKEQHGYSINIITAERTGFGKGPQFAEETQNKNSKSTLTGLWQPGRITIAGGISSADVPALERICSISDLEAELNYDPNNNYSLDVKIEDLLKRQRIAGDILAFDRASFSGKSGLFNSLQRFFSRYRPIGTVDINLKAWGNLDRLSESTLVGEVYCKDVSICDRKFAYPIEHITGRIDFTENIAVLNDLRGQHNNVKVSFNGRSKDFGPNRQYEIRIASDNMALDNDLYDALNTKKKEFWNAFSPTGVAKIDYRLSRQSQTDKKRTLNVELLGAEAICRHFPYPLKNLTGKLVFERESVQVSQLVSQYNGRQITLNGAITDCDSDRPIYDISIKANDIPLDSTLSAALPSKQRDFYNQFDTVGRVDADVKIFTPEQDLRPASFIADVSFKETSLKINRPALAISDISAQVAFTPDLLRIENLTGRYGQGTVSLAGQIWPADETKKLGYCLSLQAEQVHLNDDLIGVLPTPFGKIVSELQLKGRINLDAHLNKDAAADCPAYKVTVDCLGNSIESKPFPYPLKDVTGSLTITKDGIKLANITATTTDNIPETVKLSALGSPVRLNGEIVLADGAFSSGSFQLDANDISFDERLGSALPIRRGGRDYYFKLSPIGRFDLDLESVNIVSAETDANGGEKYVDFAGTAKFKNCSFNIFAAVSELEAVLQAKGSYKTGAGFADGQMLLLADGLRIQGKSFTSLKADIGYDQRHKNWSAKNLVADCHGGRLKGKFEFRQPSDKVPEYLLQVGFDNINLKQFLSDSNQKSELNSHTSGKMCGSLSIASRLGEDLPYVGRCRLQITDMQVGKLSPLARLLYVLRLTEPRDFAFEQMLIDSYIKNGRLFFEKFDLSGQALAFSGSGWMDLQSQNVNLILTARGPRLATAEPSILQSLTEGLGHAVVRMEVTGNVNNPHVATKAFPVIKDSLQILGIPR